MPARAIDNRCYIVVSSLYEPAMIINTLGETVAEATNGLISSELDLSFRPTPHPNAGGSLNSSPGGRRSVRNALSHRVYEEILDEVSTWENRPDRFDWLRKDSSK